ncbi:hypothetical protein PLICRDRAFT_103985 [Plicaturopsis crispa FD-325 SS-3]|nr:hypothetical protein PLICRDRAFT_103985 [Plicaturopsis crispa FD-325 SS-3]
MKSDPKVEKSAKKKDKGKSKASESDFQDLRASLVVPVPPIFANNPRAGVEEMLDSMVMRYIPALRGVVIAHANMQFVEPTSKINADSPYAISKVGFDATVWSPHVGMKLVGKVNLCSPDHISLLIHRTFNASIPRHHIPTDQWEFEYGPAENDPEFGTGAVAEGELEEDAIKIDHTAEESEGGGKWIHKVTATPIGGKDGFLEFTVIGLTVANEMLSLLGSIQLDPFSPDHVPDTGNAKRAASEPASDISLDDLAVDNQLDVGREEEEESIRQYEKEEEEEGEEEEEDPFQQLGRLGDEAAAREAERRAEEAAEAAKAKAEKAERKRKRKEAKALKVKTEDGVEGEVKEKKKTKRKKT